MGRGRELSKQLLHEPFNEVKARVVRFRIVHMSTFARSVVFRQTVQLYGH
jgi:hypothetical protein